MDFTFSAPRGNPAGAVRKCVNQGIKPRYRVKPPDKRGEVRKDRRTLLCEAGVARGWSGVTGAIGSWDVGMSKLLIALGLILVAVGLVWMLGERLGLGRLPGDIVIEREGTRIHIPITTSIIVSIALSLLLWFFNR